MTTPMSSHGPLETIGGPTSMLRSAEAVPPSRLSLPPQHAVTVNTVPATHTLEQKQTASAHSNQSSPTNITMKQRDPRVEQEQALFEQRLGMEPGVAIKKINQHGKSSLRYVRCITHPEELEAILFSKSNRSVVSSKTVATTDIKNKPCLVWGKRKDTIIPIDKFSAVRKGKHTSRTKKSTAPENCLLSLLSDDPNMTLDIEAPTRMDRDKFARAFSKFLKVPLLETNQQEPNTHVEDTSLPTEEKRGIPPLPRKLVRTPSDPASASQMSSTHHPYNNDSSNPASSSHVSSSYGIAVSSIPPLPPRSSDEDDASQVSSLTGHGYDQELVEELHHALNELRRELDESRAEAARAVKVAEQAIQSAEKSDSHEWQNTVTHKAAEAAALAHKRLSEALVKQREAEDKLASEKRAASFWRKQAEIVEEESGVLQTRAAVAEVQRAAVQQQLESERRMLEEQVASLRLRYSTLETRQHLTLEQALERSRALEVELDSARKGSVQQSREDVENTHASPTTRRKRVGFGSRKRGPLSSGSSAPKTPLAASDTFSTDGHPKYSTETLLQLHSDSLQLRQQFEMLRRSMSDQLKSLPASAKLWNEQVSMALGSANNEIQRLQSSLAAERATRRKLLHEVQDLRGTVRVYCRPKPAKRSSRATTVLIPSQDTLVLNTDRYSVKSKGPTSFEFDCIFQSSVPQMDLYTEIEDICMGALDGYRVCTLTHGTSRSGKTYTLLGNIQPDTGGKVTITDYGVQLRCIEQLFSVAQHRSDRYKDSFTMSIVEVYNDRLLDLLIGTALGDTRGQVILASEKKARRRNESKASEDDSTSGRPVRLEIRSDVHGDTVVQGALSVTVDNFDEVISLWEDTLSIRRNRLVQTEAVSLEEYESSSHMIATLAVSSTNIATGVCSQGRIQFVDLAASDLAPRSGKLPSPSRANRDSVNTVSYQNRALETLNEVVAARCEFNRSVPYRNSTLTHLLRDSLESDTKVILLACVSSEPSEIEATAETLRFASRMRRLNIGKATRHVVSP